MQQPEAYIGSAAQLFDAKGQITKETTRDFLVKYMDAFAAWVAKNSSKNL
jgi:chromate reductase